MKVFDEVKIAVETMFGALFVTNFTIICEIDKDNRIYGLIAQNHVLNSAISDHVFVGQYMADNTWRLSNPVKLMDISIDTDIIHHDVTE